MKNALLVVVILFGVSSDLMGQKWKYVQKGIQIIEGLYAASQIYDWLNEDEGSTAVSFRTNSSSAISVSVNDIYVGQISSSGGLTCKVNAGYITYKARSSNGRVFVDRFYMEEGKQHDVFISTDYSNTRYVDNSLSSSVIGDRVNVRTDPVIRADNILMKAYNGQAVSILDRYIIAGEENDRITNKKCWFYPEDDVENKFLIVKGNAVKRIRSWDENFDKVTIYSNNKPAVGYINKADLDLMRNKKWFKVRIDGIEGWIYGDFIRA